MNKTLNAMARATRESEKQKTEELIKEIAEELSKNKKFIKCKNNAERSILVERFYPDIAQSKVNINKLIRRAKALVSLRKKEIDDVIIR